MPYRHRDWLPIPESGNLCRGWVLDGEEKLAWGSEFYRSSWQTSIPSTYPGPARPGPIILICQAHYVHHPNLSADSFRHVDHLLFAYVDDTSS